jgi:hypothetical protein
MTLAGRQNYKGHVVPEDVVKFVIEASYFIASVSRCLGVWPI